MGTLTADKWVNRLWRDETPEIKQDNTNEEMIMNDISYVQINMWIWSNAPCKLNKKINT